MSRDLKKSILQERASNTEAVKAEGHASAKIIQTFQDKAASYALGLAATASVSLLSDVKGIRGNISAGQKKLARDVLSFLGQRDYGLEISLESGIPPGVGLGEDEAASIAIVLAITGAVAKRHGSVNLLRIDKYVKEQYMWVGEKLIDKRKLLALCPGEYDRLFVSLYGGFAVCDNRKKEVLRRGEMETMEAVIAIPKKKEKPDKERMLLYRHEAERIYDECLKGNLYVAMRLNSLLYGDRIVPKMLSAGAVTAHTSYPSTVGLSRDPRRTRMIEKAAGTDAKTLVVSAENAQAAAQIKPRRIVKSREFVEQKGSQDYFFL